MGATITCLAQNIYFEARDQPTIGQRAVAEVVLNRVHDPRWPDTVCEVVREGPTYSWKQDYPIKHRCQFSWYCDGKPDKPKNIEQYEEMFKFAMLIVKGELSLLDITDGALWYHADYVKPDWSYHKKITTEIGDHIFYTMKEKVE